MSNELKVTGGEWVVSEHAFKEYGDTEFCPLAIFAKWPDGTSYQLATVVGDVSDLDPEANAHLLAASKKLYEALIQARESLAEGLETPGFAEAPGSESDRVLIAEIDAAIAAARGEDQ